MKRRANSTKFCNRQVAIANPEPITIAITARTVNDQPKGVRNLDQLRQKGFEAASAICTTRSIRGAGLANISRMDTARISLGMHEKGEFRNQDIGGID